MHRTKINIRVSFFTASNATLAGMETECGKERSLNLTIPRARDWTGPRPIKNLELQLIEMRNAKSKVAGPIVQGVCFKVYFFVDWKRKKSVGHQLGARAIARGVTNLGEPQILPLNSSFSVWMVEPPSFGGEVKPSP
jgi:hypothetical protein